NRRDLTVMEESELLQMLVRAGWKYKDIAAKFGKTERWVSRRVGLARLDARWVEQYENPASPVSTWTIGHLELLAALPVEVQRDVLMEIDPAVDPDYCYSLRGYRNFSEYINTNYAHNLASAPWRLDAEDLVVGAPSCAKC